MVYHRCKYGTSFSACGFVCDCGTGSLTKVGENITDETVKLARSIWSVLSRMAPNTEAVRQTAPSGSGSVDQTMLKNVKVMGDIDLGDLTQEA